MAAPPTASIAWKIASTERGMSSSRPLQARMMLGWPKSCKLANAFLWEYSHKRLKLVQLLAWANLASLALGRVRRPLVQELIVPLRGVRCLRA